MIAIDEIGKLALKSILRNKSRSILTMLGIIIGVAAVILLVSLGQGLQKYITGQFEELGSNLISVLPGKVSLEGGFSSSSAPNFSGSKLTLSMVADLKRIGGPIEDVSAAIEYPVTIKYEGVSKYTTAAGMMANYANLRNLKVGKGRQISDSDVKLSRKVAIIGTGLATKFFGQSNPIGKQVTIGSDKYEVIGILEKLGSGGLGFDVDNYVAVPITTAQKTTGISTVQAIVVKASSKNYISDAIRLTKMYFSKKLKSDEYSVIDSTNLLSSINQILGVLTAALGGIAAISLVVGGVGIMNIMLVSVTERTREIGLRKAIGAKPSDILYQFVMEAVALSVTGGLIGILIGWGGSLIINRFFPAAVTLWSISLAFGVSAIVGIVFGVAPAIRASRLDPIEALRYE